MLPRTCANAVLRLALDMDLQKSTCAWPLDRTRFRAIAAIAFPQGAGLALNKYLLQISPLEP